MCLFMMVTWKHKIGCYNICGGFSYKLCHVSNKVKVSFQLRDTLYFIGAKKNTSYFVCWQNEICGIRDGSIKLKEG